MTSKKQQTLRKQKETIKQLAVGSALLNPINVNADIIKLLQLMPYVEKSGKNGKFRYFLILRDTL